MTEKPTVEGLMALVDQFGVDRWSEGYADGRDRDERARECEVAGLAKLEVIRTYAAALSREQGADKPGTPQPPYKSGVASAAWWRGYYGQPLGPAKQLQSYYDEGKAAAITSDKGGA